jgi:putative ABC transport system permease protein
MLRRFRRLFRKSRAENDLDRELHFHVEKQIADNIAAGMSPAEARRRAQLEFGGIEAVKEEVRESRWEIHLENLARDFHYTFRNLQKDRRFALVAIFALALGIGASTVVFSVFYNLLFNAFAARDASRLVVPIIRDIENAGQGLGTAAPLNLHLADLDLVRAQNHVFENVVGYLPNIGAVLASDGPHTYQFSAAQVTSDAFEFYGVPPLLGRAIVREDGNPGAPGVFVISHKTWKGVFDEDASVLGKSFIIDGEPRTLVGVMPPRFQAFGPQEQVWVPIVRTPGTPRSDGEFPAQVLGRLKSGITVQAASADMDVIVKRIAAQHPKDFPKRFIAGVGPAVDVLMGPSGGGPLFHSDMKHLLYNLLGAVLILLLIACGNVANLLLARASVREKEMAVRSALGATRGRLVQQLLVESFLLSLAACMAGCLFAWCGLRLVTELLPRILGSTSQVASQVAHVGPEVVLGLNPPVLFFAICLAALTTVICGLAPALHVLGKNLRPQLTTTGKGVSGGFRYGKLRAALVIVEVALSIVLLMGGGLMVRSFFLLTHVHLGFNPNSVLMVVFLPPPSHGSIRPAQRFASPQGRVLLQAVVERLRAMPGVSDVAIEDTIPGYGPTIASYETSVPGTARTEQNGLLACDENFLHVLEMRQIQGRWLSRDEVQSARDAVVINQRLADDFFHGQNPIGQQLRVERFQTPDQLVPEAIFQIVGVVADIKTAGPEQPSIPLIFLPYTVRGSLGLLLKTTVPPASLTRAIQEQVWAADRDEIVWMSTPLTEFLQNFTYATPEFALMIAAPLAAVALFLVVIGIFSVMAYTVSLQTHEIGIRMALGARQANILKMILAKGVA